MVGEGDETAGRVVGGCGLAFFIDLLPVDGAGTSTLSHPFVLETTAVTLDETQIDLGEGPARDARTTGRPVVLQLAAPELERAVYPEAAVKQLAARMREDL